MWQIYPLHVLFLLLSVIFALGAATSSSSLGLGRANTRSHHHCSSIQIPRGGSTDTSTSTTTTVSSKPSWLQMDPATLAKYMELAKQRHKDAVKAAEESYYSSTLSTTTTTTPTLPSVHSFGIAAPSTWSLPDFSEDFNLAQVIYVTETPLFSTEECNQVIHDAETHFSSTHSPWTKLPSGQYNVAGFWIKSVPAVHEWFNNAIKTKLFPLIQQQFPEFCSADDLVVDNAYLFKYTTKTGRRTDVHTDSGCLSFTIALNSPDEYEGGGTWFESLDNNDSSKSTNTVEMDQGMVTVRPGGVRHCGQAIREGTRYIIGGFCMHRSRVEPVRMLIGLASERAAQGDLSGAEEAYMASLSINSKFDASYANFADVLQKQGKTQQAKEVLEYCHFHVNPQNAEVAYSLGVLYLEEGEYEACKACMSICLESDDCDVEAMLVLAQACEGQGDGAGEEAWYRQVTETPGVANDKAASAYNNLGVMKQGTDEEIQLYEKGLQLSPNHYQLRYSLGSAHALQKKYAEAAKHFRVAVETCTGEQQNKALQLLYRAASMAIQSDTTNMPPTREAMIERLQGIMGKENYEALAATAARR